MSKIPNHVVEAGLRLAATALYLGVPLRELTRHELLACAAEGWAAYNRLLNSNIDKTIERNKR